MIALKRVRIIYNLTISNHLSGVYKKVLSGIGLKAHYYVPPSISWNLFKTDWESQLAKNNVSYPKVKGVGGRGVA